MHLRSKGGWGEYIKDNKIHADQVLCQPLHFLSESTGLNHQDYLKRAGNSGLQHSSCLHWEEIPSTPLQLKLETSIWTSIWTSTPIWKEDAGTVLCSLGNAVTKAQILWNPSPPDQRRWALNASTSHSIKGASPGAKGFLMCQSGSDKGVIWS